MPKDEFDDMIMLRRLQNGGLQEVGREPGSKPVPPGFLMVTEKFWETFLGGDDQ